MSWRWVPSEMAASAFTLGGASFKLQLQVWGCGSGVEHLFNRLVALVALGSIPVLQGEVGKLLSVQAKQTSWDYIPV